MRGVGCFPAVVVAVYIAARRQHGFQGVCGGDYDGVQKHEGQGRNGKKGKYGC